jgi:hypothetical protein
VPYTGDGVSQSAIDALQVLLDDEDLDEERLVKQVDYYTAAEIARDLLAEQAYQPVHTDIALQKHAKVETPRRTYYGIARLADLVALHKDARQGAVRAQHPLLPRQQPIRRQQGHQDDLARRSRQLLLPQQRRHGGLRRD